MNIKDVQKKDRNVLVVLILISVMIAITVNSHYGRDIVYTHLFYFPIVLAGLRYYRKAIFVAASLGVFHILINYLKAGVFLPGAVLRSIIFCVIAFTVGYLAEKKDEASFFLKKTLQEKALILQSLSELVIYFDREQRIVWTNPAATQRYGTDVQGLQGKNCNEVWCKQEAPPADCPVRRALETGWRAQSSEVTTPDGRIWGITASPVFDHAGLIVGAVATGLDITDRKLAEEALLQTNERLRQAINKYRETENALQESEERYRVLVNNASEAIVVVQDKFIKFANPVAIKLLDCTAEGIASHHFFEFIYPDDRSLILERNQKRMEGEVVEGRYSFRIMANGGSIKWVENSAVTIEWEGRLATLCLLADITERKKIEEEMIKADKLETVGLLAGGIAHDFNNFLASLLGNITIAKLYRDDMEKVLKKLDNMEKVTERAKDLANQLFTFAKSSEPIKKRVKLGKLIPEEVKFILSGSNVRPIFSIAEDLYTVEVDRGQFSQVLGNIVINAVQAMPEGGLLDVGVENITSGGAYKKGFLLLPEGAYIKISIKDGGKGIPEEFLTKIFAPFFTTKEKGRGLGLATSYSIIKKHGGHLSVESEVGVGTKFFIFLPAADQPAAIQVRAGSIYQGAGKILIMDDEEELRTTMGELLLAYGHDVLLARDGSEALDLYLEAIQNAEPFQLVIIDLTVPGGMGGKQTIKELLKIDPDVKAIVASGYSSDPVMANYRDYGFVGAIRKPFSPEKLTKLVYEAIGQGTHSRSDGVPPAEFPLM